MAEQLAQLALVSKICTELEKHIGTGDKNLAEFVIHLAKESKYDKDKFAKNLESNGAKFPKVLFEENADPSLETALGEFVLGSESNALMTAGGAPIAPASPAPFMPRGFVLHNISL